jgi:succinyl-diaminopimelate desuccinylase
MSSRDELIRLTSALVAIPSVTEDAVGRTAVIDYIEQYCASLPGVQTFRYESDGKPSLVAAFDAVRHKTLILNAHVDVVPGRDDQFSPIVRDGRIYGRGTQDMKAAAAAMLLVLKELAEEGRRPSVSWQFVTDEEIGGEHGTGYLFANGYTGDFFLAGEPTDLEIVNRAKGILWVDVRLVGNPAHGSRPWDGMNPIPPLATGITRVLERYPIPEAPIWRTTVTPSAIHGGDAHNRVPTECLLKLDIRRVPEEDAETIMQFVSDCFDGAEVTVLHNGSTLQSAEDDPHIRQLQLLVTAEQGGASFRSEHFGSDARFYSEVGIAAVCFGPHGAGLHSHEEWVDIASLERFYRILGELVRAYD